MSEQPSKLRKQWYEHVSRCEQSGIYGTDYCKRHDLNLHQFYHYRRLYLQTKQLNRTAQPAKPSLIPIKLSTPLSLLPQVKKAPVIESKPDKATKVELKLSSVNVITNDQANTDFIVDLVKKLNSSC